MRAALMTAGSILTPGAGSPGGTAGSRVGGCQAGEDVSTPPAQRLSPLLTFAWSARDRMAARVPR